MGFILLFFLVFGFSMVFCSLAKTSRKPKKTKSSDPWQGLGRGLARDMGLICFSIVFLHVFHVKMLSSQYLSKNARFYNLHTCAPHEYPFCMYIYIYNACMYAVRMCASQAPALAGRPLPRGVCLAHRHRGSSGPGRRAPGDQG